MGRCFPATSRIAAAIAVTLLNRAFGSTASAVDAIATSGSAQGAPRGIEAAGRSPASCLDSISASVPCVKRRLPPSVSHKSTPSEYTSARVSAAASPRRISGAE